MKSHISPARRAALLAAAVPLLMLAGCGQKGPLFMPAVPPDPLVRAQPQPDAPKPVAGAASASGSSEAKPAAGDK